jgi:hypothetical protein
VTSIRKAQTKMPAGPHLYVLAEVGGDGPVKIGLNTRSDSASGRSGLSSGNWRELEVLCRRRLHPAALRWSEWIIHRRLRSHQERGEWFWVRQLVADNDWCGFIDGVLSDSIDGLDDWELTGANGCRLDHMVALSPDRRHFAAHCACEGEPLVGEPGQALPTVQKRFAVEHLGLSPADPQVIELEPQVDKMVHGQRRVKHPRRAVPEC